jgi:hypothetical protein
MGLDASGSSHLACFSWFVHLNNNKFKHSLAPETLDKFACSRLPISGESEITKCLNFYLIVLNTLNQQLRKYEVLIGLKSNLDQKFKIPFTSLSVCIRLPIFSLFTSIPCWHDLSGSEEHFLL